MSAAHHAIRRLPLLAGLVLLWPVPGAQAYNDLTPGVPMRSRQVEFRGGEGDAAQPLGQIQRLFPGVVIGSYPFQAPDGFATNLVLRSRNEAALEDAYQAVCRMAQALTAEGKARGWS